VILEQNVDPGGRKVQQHSLITSSRAPVVKTEFKSMKDADGKLRRAKVVTTTTTTVAGRIWAYRPQAAGE
jgi:hypothetical protein